MDEELKAREEFAHRFVGAIRRLRRRTDARVASETVLQLLANTIIELPYEERLALVKNYIRTEADAQAGR